MNSKEDRFMKNLYRKAEKKLKEIDILTQKDEEDIIKLIGYAILVYDIDKEYKQAERLVVTAVANMVTKEDDYITEFLEDGLLEMLNEVCDFYDFELLDYQKEKIIKEAYKGLDFYQRKDKHMNFLENKMKMLAKQILKQNKQGLKETKRTPLNKNKALIRAIRNLFKAQDTKIQRLFVSEITRIRNNVFIRENKGKLVIYNSVLERNTCEECKQLDGSVFLAEEALDLIPQHANCKCYWTLATGQEL